MINDLKKLVRTGDLVLHCTKVKIWQELGLRLSGYGTIKIDSMGQLKLEFICIEKENIPRILFYLNVPEDGLIQEQQLYLEVETLDGSCYESRGFSIRLDFGMENSPVVIEVLLSSISCTTVLNIENETQNHLYFEFSEYFDIPANKSNKEESTLGSISVSRNQSVIDCDSFSINLIKMKGYVTAVVSGCFDVKNVLECLKFYIGFSCGSMPQPYYVCERTGVEIVTKICSINNSYRNKISSNPMVSNVGGDYNNKEYHYQLFKNILNVRSENRKVYDSIYSQWYQVWYSFQSINSIAALTLSVAIEGLLLDIFIPIIETKNRDEDLDADVKKIKEIISDLEIDIEYKVTLHNSISYLKKQTAAKALNYLIDREIITKDEKKLWSDLRNACAHPKIKDDSPAVELVERERVLSCLNLFHNLVFNALSYTGPRNYFRVKNISRDCDFVTHIAI
ncbi:hypothetical protein [Janthinobacterium sp. B9-8]|uniref:hypothetical protein n=1 Tax=Janthinobacterium sp. B9-8 TaxID=1236179 RepID=UPI00061D08CA|nr:hypothetical protein [Janthinobacterium sp. B9-8]AMC35334.1 hypothetical protein VN23_12300 [Janthinobacterium sp. B9-8]